MKSGYQDAIRIAEEKLKGLDPEAVCLRTGAVWDNGIYRVPWFGGMRKTVSGSMFEQVLWLHYLTSEGTKQPTGRLIAYREVPGALFYESKFTARAVRPIVRRFGSNPGALAEAGFKLGGRPADMGDASVTVSPLPHLPLTYILWGGDGEMEAEGNVLFDETAPGWLPAEDLVVLASLGAYALIGEGA